MERYVERRGRSSSVASDEDINKRKREVETEAEGAFQKSKKTIRSPNHRQSSKARIKEKGDSMEVVLAKLEEMSKQMKKMEERRKEDTEKIRGEIKNFKEDLSREMARREELWRKEKEEMQKRIESLEEKLGSVEDKQRTIDKKERRRNIIVRLELEEKDKNNRNNLREKLKNLCKNTLQVNVEFEEVSYIKTKKGGLVKATAANMEDKLKIMRSKNKL